MGPVNHHRLGEGPVGREAMQQGIPGAGDMGVHDRLYAAHAGGGESSSECGRSAMAVTGVRTFSSPKSASTTPW